MTGHANTGTPGIYEDGDEHNYSRKAIHQEQRHHLHHNVEGYMQKDRSKGMNEMLSRDTKAQVEERYKSDPLYSATMHGNQPSRGAKQDAEIQAEEAEILKKKKEKTDSMTGKKLEHRSAGGY